MLYATERFYTGEPEDLRGFVEALEEAAKFVTANPEKAADIYLKATNSKLDRELLLKVIRNPQVSFKIEPQNTLGLGQFMHRVGAIKTEPKSLSDYFFASPRTATGS